MNFVCIQFLEFDKNLNKTTCHLKHLKVMKAVVIPNEILKLDK